MIVTQEQQERTESHEAAAKFANLIPEALKNLYLRGWDKEEIGYQSNWDEKTEFQAGTIIFPKEAKEAVAWMKKNYGKTEFILQNLGGEFYYQSPAGMICINYVRGRYTMLFSTYC